MSIEIESKGTRAMEQDKRGLKDIPETLRKGMRMNKKQLRWSIVFMIILAVGLMALMIFAQGKASEPLRAADQIALLRDADGAERIEIVNNSTSIQLSEHEAKIDEATQRRLVLIQKSGANDDYWFFVCAENELPVYQESFKKKAKDPLPAIIALESEGDQILYVTRAQGADIERSIANLDKQGIKVTYLALNKLASSVETPDAESAAALLNDDGGDETAEDGEDASLGLVDLSDTSNPKIVMMKTMLSRLSFLQFQPKQGGDIMLTRGTDLEKQVAKAAMQRMNVIRWLIVLALIAVAGVLAFMLKSKKILTKEAAQQRKMRLITLAVAAVLLGVLIFVSILTNNATEQYEHVSPYSFNGVDETEDAAEAGQAEAGEETVTFHYNYRNGVSVVKDENGKAIRGEDGKTIQQDNITKMFVTLSENTGRNGIFRVIEYAAMALLVILVYALLYYFRYERDLGFTMFNVAILCVLMIITIYPVLNTVAYSFNEGTDAARGGIGIWPRKFSTKSYADVLKDSEILRAAEVSVKKTIITTVLNLFWTGMLAFTLTRKEYVLGKYITVIMVLTMYVNAGLIPNYLLISQTLGLRNTFWVYIIPTMFSCFNMIVIRTYIASLPNELVESARIDGAGDFRIYWQIIFPLCAPVLATVALFVAVGAWNSWFDTMLYNTEKSRVTGLRLDTLQYYLKGKLAGAARSASQANNTADASTELAKSTTSEITMRSAVTVVTALPILAVYPFLQRYFVTGMALGSVKG